jgi:hypothetical protein
MGLKYSPATFPWADAQGYKLPPLRGSMQNTSFRNTVAYTNAGENQAPFFAPLRQIFYFFALRAGDP